MSHVHLLNRGHAAADDGLAGLAQRQELALVLLCQHHCQRPAFHNQRHPVPAVQTNSTLMSGCRDILGTHVKRCKLIFHLLFMAHA